MDIRPACPPHLAEDPRQFIPHRCRASIRILHGPHGAYGDQHRASLLAVSKICQSLTDGICSNGSNWPYSNIKLASLTLYLLLGNCAVYIMNGKKGRGTFDAHRHSKGHKGKEVRVMSISPTNRFTKLCTMTCKATEGDNARTPDAQIRSRSA